MAGRQSHLRTSWAFVFIPEASLRQMHLLVSNFIFHFPRIICTYFDLYKYYPDDIRPLETPETSWAYRLALPLRHSMTASLPIRTSLEIILTGTTLQNNIFPL